MISRTIRRIKRDGILIFAVDIIKYTFRFRGRIAYRNMLNLRSQKDVFSAIYEHNLWSSDESRSGIGSEISYTVKLRKWLIKKINSLNIETFVDAPCGDFNWMNLVVSQVNVNYVGLDIVDSLIKQNIAMHSSDKISFEVANICEDNLPDSDIIMVRDCLFHLSYQDINSFLVNLSKTDYKYLLTTTHIVDQNFKNSDIKSGEFRIIDLFSSPFSFKNENVKDRVDDFPDGFSLKREMILIEKKYVPKQLKVELV